MSHSSDSFSPALARDAAWVHRLARCLLDDVAEAEDLAQDVLLEACRAPAPREEDRRGWLAGVARHLAHRRHRRRAVRERWKRRSGAGPSEEEGTVDVLTRLEARSVLIQAVLALEDPYRSVVVRRFLAERSVEEIAESDGVPPATVYTRLRRATETLRERLDGKLSRGSLGLLVVGEWGEEGGAGLVDSSLGDRSLARISARTGIWKVSAILLVLPLPGAVWLWRAVHEGSSDPASMAHESTHAGTDGEAATPRSAPMLGELGVLRESTPGSSSAPEKVVQDREDDAIEGVVLDESGRPMADVSGHLIIQGSNDRGSATAWFRTGPDGTFRRPLSSLPLVDETGWSVDLLVRDEHNDQRWATRRGITAPTRVVLQMGPAPTIDLRVFHASGQPVTEYGAGTAFFGIERWDAKKGEEDLLESLGTPEYLLKDFARQMPHTHRGIFDLGLGPRHQSAGVCELSIRPEPFLVAIFVPGQRPQWRGPFTATRYPDELLFILPEPPRQRTQILGPDGPMEGVLVDLLEMPDEENSWPHVVDSIPQRPARWLRLQARSDADGWVEFGLRPGRRTAVRARAAGFADTFGPEILGPADCVVQQDSLELTRGGALRVTVVPPAGQSTEGLKIVAYRGDGEVLRRVIDATGQLVLEHLTPGRWCVQQSMGSTGHGFREDNRVPPPWNVELSEGETTDFLLDLRAGLCCRVEGRIQVDGKALRGHLWKLDSQCTHQDPRRVIGEATDHFLLETVQTGHTILGFDPSEPPFMDWCIEKSFQLHRGATKWEQDVATGVLRGRLPEAIAGQALDYRIEIDGCRFLVPIPCDAEGRYELRVPAGAGSVHRSPRRVESQFKSGRLEPNLLAEATVLPGESTAIQLED